MTLLGDFSLQVPLVFCSKAEGVRMWPPLGSDGCSCLNFYSHDVFLALLPASQPIELEERIAYQKTENQCLINESTIVVLVFFWMRRDLRPSLHRQTLNTDTADRGTDLVDRPMTTGRERQRRGPCQTKT
jgi:hypothetical protein